MKETNIQYQGNIMDCKLCQWALGLVVSLVLATPVFAAAPQTDPYDVIESTTKRVMAVVVQAEDYADADPQRYYDELQPILDEVVDFAGFSRAIMGPYASRQRYQGLSKEGKQELRAQVERFTEVMRTGLVRTYGKGLIAFGGSKTEVQRPQGATSEGNSTSITQLIYSDAAEPYVIQYQMRKTKTGWKLRNLIVETINLGLIYRNQFQAAAQDSEGDLNTVIANWVTPAEVDSVGEADKQSARL